MTKKLFTLRHWFGDQSDGFMMGCMGTGGAYLNSLAETWPGYVLSSVLVIIAFTWILFGEKRAKWADEEPLKVEEPRICDDQIHRGDRVCRCTLFIGHRGKHKDRYRGESWLRP